MNILHTSDWHLGKRLMERERLEEQAQALDELVEICEKEQVELVLVAGDIFDTYTPSAEAEELFFSAVKKLAGETRAVVLVSGNHDDGVRLAAGAPLAQEKAIYLFGNKPSKISLSLARPVRAVEAGDYYVTIENEAGERVYINALPYPNEARFKETRSEESFPDKISRWIARGEEGYDGKIPHILLTHLFVAGGKTSESERDIDLGGARAVPLSCLPQEGYIALGHLHKPQKVGDFARYSGSLLQYSFDEANTQKQVILLSTQGKEVNVVKEIPLVAGKKLVRLECRSAEEALQLLPVYENCFIELTLHLREPLTTRQTQALRDCNEGLISLITRVQTEEVTPLVSRSKMSDSELFSAYHRSIYGEEPSKEVLTAFLELLGGEV